MEIVAITVNPRAVSSSQHCQIFTCPVGIYHALLIEASTDLALKEAGGSFTTINYSVG